MDRDLNRNIDTTYIARYPDGKWITWALWSSISLVAALVAVLIAGIDPGLLLGWAAAIIIGGMLMVFRRQEH
jgi:hypothetical protein